MPDERQGDKHGKRRRGWWLMVLMAFDAVFRRKTDPHMQRAIELNAQWHVPPGEDEPHMRTTPNSWASYVPRSPRNSILLPPEHER